MPAPLVLISAVGDDRRSILKLPPEDRRSSSQGSKKGLRWASSLEHWSATPPLHRPLEDDDQDEFEEDEDEDEEEAVDVEQPPVFRSTAPAQLHETLPRGEAVPGRHSSNDDGARASPSRHRIGTCPEKA